MGLILPIPRSRSLGALVRAVETHDPRDLLRALWLERWEDGEAAPHEAAAEAHTKAWLIERHYPAQQALAAHLHGLSATLAPDNPTYHANHARVLTRLGRLEEARAAFDQALACGGGLDVVAARADARALAGDVAGAAADDAHVGAHDLPAEVPPDVAHNTAFGALRAGAWRRGWRWYQGRKGSLMDDVTYSARPLPRAAVPWDGRRTDRPVVILWEQGLGDTVMLLRWVAWARTRTSAGVYLEVQPPLVRWAAETGATVRAVSLLPDGRRAWPADFPADPAICWTFDLPFLAGMRYGSDIPAPYAPSVPPVAAEDIVVVHPIGSGGHRNDARRSLPREQWPALVAAARDRGLTPVSVQPDAAWRAQCADLGVVDRAGGDFLDTARVLRAARAVVTVDTALAHVAGSLGVRTHVLLDICAEWRWGLAGRTTPWYPSVRLYRQQVPGEWAPIVAQAVADA